MEESAPGTLMPSTPAASAAGPGPAPGDGTPASPPGVERPWNREGSAQATVATTPMPAGATSASIPAQLR
jgi:hypothetical protein